MPLISLTFNHFVPDELHLVLIITDVLLKNLIDDTLEIDGEYKVRRMIPFSFETIDRIFEYRVDGFHIIFGTTRRRK